MHKQQGITLVELMISITLGLILMGGVIQMFVASKQTFSTQEGLARVQETGRLAVEIMSRDIRMAGYMGCGTRQFTANRRNDGGMCRVHGSVGCITNGLGNRDDPDGGMVDFSGSPILGFRHNDDGNPVSEGATQGDVIVLRSAGESSFTTTDQAGGNSAFRVNAQGVGNCVGGICPGDVIMLSDCSSGRVFQASGISNGNPSNISHGVATGRPPGNVQGDPNWTSDGQVIPPGAEMFKISRVAYYINQPASQPGEPEQPPTLMRQVNDRDAVPLLEGVENMLLTYSANGQDYFERDPNLNWDDVTSVRLRLLVRSTEGNIVPDPEGQQNIEFGDEDVATADRRLRQVFTATVSIRSRLP